MWKVEDFYSQDMGALSPLLGSRENIEAAHKLALQLSPRPEEPDPATLAFLFFSQMAAEGAKPGATFLSSAGAAAAAPGKYLMQHSARQREYEKEIPFKTIELAKLLKPETLTLYAPFNKTVRVAKDSDAYRAAIINGYSDKEPGAPTTTKDPFDRLIWTGGVPQQFIGKSQAEFPIEKIKALMSEQHQSGTTGSQEALPQLTTPTAKSLLPPLTIVQDERLQKYRKEVLEAEKKFLPIHIAFQNIKEWYETQTPMSDYSLAVGYAKIIDPSSAAREGEVRSISEAGALPAALMQKIKNSLEASGAMYPELRKNILDSSVLIYNNNLAAFNKSLYGVADPKKYQPGEGKGGIKEQVIAYMKGNEHAWRHVWNKPDYTPASEAPGLDKYPGTAVLKKLNISDLMELQNRLGVFKNTGKYPGDTKNEGSPEESKLILGLLKGRPKEEEDAWNRFRVKALNDLIYDLQRRREIGLVTLSDEEFKDAVKKLNAQGSDLGRTIQYFQMWNRKRQLNK